MMRFGKVNAIILFLAGSFLSREVSGYAFVAKQQSGVIRTNEPSRLSRAHQQYAMQTKKRTSSSSSSLNMVDQTVLQGAGIAVAGLAVGIGLVAFTEAQGERARKRGSGLSDSMATRITGGLMEDVEVSSVDDVGSLTSQLEQALKESGGIEEGEVEMTEAEKKRIAEQAEDGW